MSPITKALVACAVVCVALYFLISEFLGSTETVRDSLDIKSLSHTRTEEKQAEPERKPVLPEAVDDVANAAPERDLIDRIDAATVLPRESSTAEPEADENAASDSADVLAVEDKLIGDSTDQDKVEEVSADEPAEAEDSAAAAEALLKETLGISEPPPPVRAVDVSYAAPPNCEASGVVLAPVAVQYRFESPTITGTSLNELEILMTEYRRCEGGAFQFAHNPLGKEDATPLLMQMRLDELKYFFLQHRVPKTALRFPDDP